MMDYDVYNENDKYIGTIEAAGAWSSAERIAREEYGDEYDYLRRSL